ncbi:MAG: trypsin-like peptidase domain-containing protein [Candidatus Dormibacteraeota bacterium]|nr:trypsin-like peptidase domain-containing protein [Candidatus Dormibacteraeota bacterium]
MDDDLASASPPPPPPPALEPPPWPPGPVRPPHSRHATRWALAATTLVAVATGGLVGWSVSGATRQQPTGAGTAPKPASGGGSSTAPGSGATPAPSSSSASVATVDQAVVDITATLSGGRGTVAGTGMVITPSGEVLTNNHVIAGTTSITVQIDGQGTVYHATVLGDDPAADVALLQISGVSGLRTVTVGDSSSVSAGESIAALGNALGQGGTPAEVPGTVTGTGQTITASDSTGTSETLNGLIQIDAGIVPGDSGGPVIDAAGHVVGMVTAGSSSGGPQPDATTTGFAIPVNSAMAVVAQIQSGTATTAVHIGGDGPFLGVAVSARGVAADGATVVGMQPGSPAASAGLVAGDVITSVEGIPVGSVQDLNTAMQRLSAGQTVTVVWHDATGAQHSARVALASGPPL